MDGNLSLKSSVLSPVSRRIFDQFDALQQLQSHRRIISNSKAIVDSSPPKSLSKSVVRQDQRLRSAQNSSRGSSRANSRLSSSSISKSLETIPNSQALPNENSSSKPSPKQRSGNLADKISWYLDAIQRSALPIMPWNKLQEAALLYNSPYAKNVSKPSVQASNANRHLGCFGGPSESLFPRPLMNKRVESKLRHMEQCYNPANRTKRPNYRKNTAQETRDLERVLQEHLRQLEHQETCYEKWLEDQAQRAEVRKEALTSRAGPSRIKNTSSSLHTPHLQLRSSDSGRESERSSQKVHAIREDEKQLEFITAVTEDILRSRLFSDSAIKHTIKLHLEERSQDLSEDKVQLLVEQLMSDLHIDGDHSDVLKSDFRR